MGSGINNRKCFESNFAAEILKNPNLFPAVDRLSTIILELLTRDHNKQYILNNTLLDMNVTNQLYSHFHFGKLGDELDFCPTQNMIYNAFINALTEQRSNMQLMLHIHQIFMQKLYDKIPDKKVEHQLSSVSSWSKLTISQRVAIKLRDNNEKDVKKAVVSQLFQNELFSEITRIKINETGIYTNKLGIATIDECPNLQESEFHQNGLGVFAPKEDSEWLREISLLNLPFVGGPSGHTGSAMLGAIMLGNMDAEELKQYTTATIGILTGGGYHSIHEIMSVAAKVGLSYRKGQYYHFLPDTVLTSTVYKELAEEYPDYLPTADTLYQNSA